MKSFVFFVEKVKKIVVKGEKNGDIENTYI